MLVNNRVIERRRKRRKGKLKVGMEDWVDVRLTREKDTWERKITRRVRNTIELNSDRVKIINNRHYMSGRERRTRTREGNEFNNGKHVERDKASKCYI